MQTSATSAIPNSPTQIPLALTQWPDGRSLDEMRNETLLHLRRQPDNADLRARMFQLHCLHGNWSGALRELQACAQAQDSLNEMAQAYRLLLRSENLRREILDGYCPPTFLHRTPNWAPQWIAALRLQSQHQFVLADNARKLAFSLLKEQGGMSNLGGFSWLLDSDTRIGPACEIILEGQYLWLPFADIAAIELTPAKQLLDLIWQPARIQLHALPAINCLIPARYPGVESADDDIKLGLSTRWQHAGSTGMTGSGQKTWITDRGSYGLSALSYCLFDARNA
ncbi:type VI secretion system accessory protein TagJ [Herbaspirillum lusitanum]|uniref:Type VI secretion system accessory protein TagJ n=1 Tax=Herbaspirillum lusitanum TaxID=213312 RepID=A0ABW9AAU2_9BURK